MSVNHFEHFLLLLLNCNIQILGKWWNLLKEGSKLIKKWGSKKSKEEMRSSRGEDAYSYEGKGNQAKE